MAYGKKKKKRKKEEQSKGMEFEYGSISMEVLKFCMDSSMILYKNYLGMDC